MTLPVLLRRFALGAGLLVAFSASAQLELLQSLSPQQQQALIKQYAGKGQAPQAQAPQQVTEPVVEKLSIDEVAPEDEATGLRPFGYELFAGAPSTFAPATDIPVPVDYVIGPGDTVLLQLYGKDNAEYELAVTRDGNLQIPELGSIGVIGLTFDELRQTIGELVSRRKIGVSANVTMGALRSITVLLLGDARQPGAYTVSSLSTISNALFVSGGIKPIGSLRNIQLKRNGKVVQTLDLYDLMLKGDTRADVRLQPGDAIFIPPVGDTVAIDGAVKRPAIYELRRESTLDDVVQMAGGLAPDAWTGRATIERYAADGTNELVQSSLDGDSRRLKLKSGDRVTVYPAVDRADNSVTIKGYAEREGAFAWAEDLRLTDVIPNAQALKMGADLDFALLVRLQDDGTRLAPLYLNPARAFAQPGSEADPVLAAGDTLYFFPGSQQHGDDAAAAKPAPAPAARLPAGIDLGGAKIGDPQELTSEAAVQLVSAGLVDSGAKLSGDEGERSSRADVIAAVVNQLHAQARVEAPAPVARIVGAVRFPGEYPLDVSGTTYADLIRAAGGLADQAYDVEIELTRPVLVGEDGRSRMTVDHQTLRLRADEPNASLGLIQPRDVLTVRYTPGANTTLEVELVGEVMFPGTYQIRQGETLLDVLQRAGGLTERAYPYGSVFTREDLKIKEQAQAQKLYKRLESSLASVSLGALSEDAKTADAYLAAQGLLDQLKSYEAVGRLVIDLPRMMAGDQPAVSLKDGDRLIVPPRANEVTVVGEVQFPTSHLYERRESRDDYVRKSGGVTDQADPGRTYIVKANGAVQVKRGWWAWQPRIDPGDTIVVPLDTTPIQPLQLATSVTQIVYQLGLAAAGFKAVGAF